MSFLYLRAYTYESRNCPTAGPTAVEIGIPWRKAKIGRLQVFQVLIQPSSPGYCVFSSVLWVAFTANWMIIRTILELLESLFACASQQKWNLSKEIRRSNRVCWALACRPLPAGPVNAFLSHGSALGWGGLTKIDQEASDTLAMPRGWCIPLNNTSWPFAPGDIYVVASLNIKCRPSSTNPSLLYTSHQLFTRVFI